MASRLKGLTKAFGILDGIKLYYQVKIKPSGWLHSKKYNTKFYLRPNTSDYYTFDQVFIRDQYNIKLPFSPKNIIDAGANIGLSSAYFANRYPDANIVAIEPDKLNFETLIKNIENFKNIKPLQMGLWNKDTYLEIINTDGVQNAFMVKETTVNHANTIPAISLEKIMKDNNWKTIDVLKIDIEGSEKELFEENTEYWLPKTRAIFVETHDNMKKFTAKSVFKATSQYNFSFSTNDENLIFINEDLINITD